MKNRQKYKNNRTWQSTHRQLSVREHVKPRISTASLYSSALDFLFLGGDDDVVVLVASASELVTLLALLFRLEGSRGRREVDVVDLFDWLSFVIRARPAGDTNSCNMSMS